MVDRVRSCITLRSTCMLQVIPHEAGFISWSAIWIKRPCNPLVDGAAIWTQNGYLDQLSCAATRVQRAPVAPRVRQRSVSEKTNHCRVSFSRNLGKIRQEARDRHGGSNAFKTPDFPRFISPEASYTPPGAQLFLFRC